MTIIFSLWLAVNALAVTSPTDIQLQILTSSRSVSDLQRAAELRSTLEVNSRQCQLDLSLRRIPHSCFAEASVRKANSLISSAEHEQKVRALSSLCRQVARTSIDIHSLNSALAADAISSSCRKAVKNRIDDLNYQVGEVRELDRFLK